MNIESRALNRGTLRKYALPKSKFLEMSYSLGDALRDSKEAKLPQVLPDKIIALTKPRLLKYTATSENTTIKEGACSVLRVFYKISKN